MRATRCAAMGLAGLGLTGLSACGIPPYDRASRGTEACLVVAASGFAFDRNCTAFELTWLPRAERLTLSRRGPDIEILEVSGRQRAVTIRQMPDDTYCRLARDYPRPRVTRDCRATGPAPPILSVRG
jgi:hypothetical protein